MRLLCRVLCLCFAALLSAVTARAEWMVYELTFTAEEEESLNFQFYTGAYVVVPLEGGTASIVLTTEQGGYFYATAENAARFFMAAKVQTQRAVLSALALNGSAQAYYTASGEVNHTLMLASPEGLRSYRVARELRGRLIASDDDSEALALASDGSLGMVGTAVIEGRLREDLTQNANQFATQKDILLYLVGLLERYGYAADGVVETTVEVAPVMDERVLNPLFPAGSAAEAARDMDVTLGRGETQP